MGVGKIYGLSTGRFFFLYILSTLLVSLLMAGIYSGYLSVFAGLPNEWFENIKRAVSVGFSIGSVKESIGEQSLSAILFAFFVIHSFVLLLINMLLQGFITARLIKPKTELKVSTHATFHPHYGHTEEQEPHILFRLVNAGASDLFSVSLKAFLVVRTKEDNGETSSLYYFPIDDIDPKEIPMIGPYSHWKVAIPIKAVSNSYVKQYDLNLHKSEGSIKGERTIEVLVSGVESAASSSFIHSFSFLLEKDSDKGFFCGDFESLPAVLGKKSLPRINARIPTAKDECQRCVLFKACIYSRK